MRSGFIWQTKRKKRYENPEALRFIGLLRDAVTDVQKKGIRKWCEKNNARIITWIKVEGSPFDPPWECPELAPWLAVADDPPEEWDGLIALTMDRVTEVETYGLELIEWCRDHEKRFVLPGQDIDSEGWIQPSVLASLFPNDPEGYPKI